MDRYNILYWGMISYTPDIDGSYFEYLFRRHMTTRMALDYLIAYVIWESNRLGQPIWFNKLEKLMGCKASRSTISKNIDKLFDYGIISGEWGKNSKGNWVRTFHISDEASALMEKIATEHRDNPDFVDVRSLMEPAS